MNAFSTYHHLTTIDFENMINHGLYLISGPTGAGKTTIFDAITFALYGSASGSGRSQSHFRSDFADAKEETYVELTFELHHKLYTVKRSPTYVRPGYKTAKLANAYLTYDSYTIEGVKEVNSKINELLGVDVHQFKQIVMIAQGEFTKLIYASSEEREKVLRHIFHTESLVAFEELLKEKTKLYKDQYYISHQQLASQYQLLSLPLDFMKAHQEGFHFSYIDEAIVENQKIYDAYQISQAEYKVIQEHYDQLSKAYYQKQKRNQDILEYQKVLHEYQNHLQQKQTIQNCHDDIEKMKLIQKNQTMIYQYHELIKEIDENNKALTHIIQEEKTKDQKLKDIQEEFIKIPVHQREKEQCLLDIHRLKEIIQQKEVYKNVKQQYLDIQSQYTKTKQRYDELNQKHSKLIKRMERDQDNVNRLSSLQLKLEKMDSLVKETNQRRLAIHELSELYDQGKNVQDYHYELSQVYQKKDLQYKKLYQQYLDEDENYKRQQAGILAKDLQEGEPCPVCGSIHHPQLAKLSSQVLSSNELEALSVRVEQAKIQKEEAYQEVVIQNEKMQNIKTRIDVYRKQLDIEEELSKEVFIRLLSDIMQITRDQEKIYQKQYIEVEYLKKVKHSLEQDTLGAKQQEEQLERLLKETHELEKQLTSLQTQMDSLKDVNESHDEHEQLSSKEKHFKEIETYIQSIDQQYHQYQKDLSLIRQRQKALEDTKKNLQELWIQRQKEFNAFMTQNFINQQEYEYYQSLLETLNDKEKQYQEYQIQERSLLTQLKNLQEYKDQQVIDLSIEEKNLKEVEDKRNQIFHDMSQQDLIYQKNQKIIEDIQKIYLKNQDVFHQYTLYQDLLDYTSGKNPQRISFERYVLSSYFEHILEYANIELLKMSNGRFALYRKLETKGAKQQGLDLSVLDYETGMVRDVQSLSGGESFKAALSLALGLSTMIQSYAGGIELNTLFIDEGFGSLDNESLDQALAVLLELKNDNKVIGIISHVSDLKERISTQIVVEKGQDGSILHIEKE